MTHYAPRLSPRPRRHADPQHLQQWSTAELGATLYELRGLEDFEFRFRVLRIREAMPADSLRVQRLQRLADQLWHAVLKNAVYPTTAFGFQGFLVPETAVPSDDWTHELRDVPDRAYSVEATDIRRVVHAQDARGPERELVSRMLERVITDRLSTKRSQLWRGEYWTLFYWLRALNEDSADLARAFRGLRFGVTLVDGNPHLAADINTRYFGRRSLAEISPDERRTVLAGHVSPSIEIDERAMFIRDNGSRKIACRYAGETEHSVAEHRFSMDGRELSVYDYYRERYPALNFSSTDRAVFVQDRRGGMTLPVPASRLFPVFSTESDVIRRCSVSPQLSPEARVQEVSQFLKFMDRMPYGGREITPSSEFRSVPRTCFAPPNLEFGGGQMLRPLMDGVHPLPRDPQFEREVLRFGASKVKAVETLRPYHNEALPDVSLFFPSDFARVDREQLVAVLATEIARLTGQDLRVGREEQYAVGSGQREGASLLRRVRDVSATGRIPFSLVILSRGFSPDVHGALKQALGSGALSQCISEHNARVLATGAEQARLPGLLRNVALAILTEAGVMPWVLSDELHHDVHIGIDLLHGQIGYHALYGRGGRIVNVAFGTALHHGRMHEHIKRPELRRRVEELLRAAASAGAPLRSLIVHRDGRWWPSEADGLREAIAALSKERVVPQDFRSAVVEVRKHHLPVRLFTKRVAQNRAQLVNPLPGSFLLLDSDRAIVATTGRPGSWENGRGRTATTLLLELTDVVGDVRIAEVAEDLYRLTHLNWSAPDIEIALPVTIRWTDRALRRTLLREERMPPQDPAILIEGVAS